MIQILINRPKDVLRAAQRIKKTIGGAKCGLRMTGFDAELAEPLRGLGIESDYSWDYLTDEERRRIDDFFFRKLVREWHMCRTPEGWGISDSDKAMLGICSEFSFVSTNHSLIKHIAVVASIFAKYAPSEVIVVEDEPYLANILSLFGGKYNFRVLKINSKANPVIAAFKNLKRAIKSFARDSVIFLLDFFVMVCLFALRKYEGRIIIDHRLYKRFSRTGLKDKLLICFFEKGLKARMEALCKGMLYFPLKFVSCFDFASRRGDVQPHDDELFRYSGIEFWGAVKGCIRHSFIYTLPRIRANRALFEKFARKKRVKAVVMRHDMKPAERNLILAARPLGVPSVVIQHGALGDPNINSVMCPADITCVWGSSVKEWYKNLGFSQDRVIVTGNPGYDELFDRICSTRQRDVRQRVCAALSLNPEKKIVSFLTSSNHLFSNSFSQGDEMERMINGILESIRMLNDIQLIIKVHPYDGNVNRYTKAIEAYGMSGNAAVLKDYNVFDILEASDLVIAMDSTTGFEALILDRPLVACNLNRGVTLVPYAERSVAIGVKDTDELRYAIREGLYNKDTIDSLRLNRDKFISDYVHKIDGKAAARVEELVANLTK